MILVESIILCFLFTVLVYISSREPIKMLYNYPPHIQERVKSLDCYKGKIPTQKDKVFVKLFAAFIFAIILGLLLKYINGCQTFQEGFWNGYLLWTIVNFFDAFILDILWFCHDPHFVIPGTEDMVSDYHDYAFHIKGTLFGQLIAIPVCLFAGLLVQYIL